MSKNRSLLMAIIVVIIIICGIYFAYFKHRAIPGIVRSFIELPKGLINVSRQLLEDQDNMTDEEISDIKKNGISSLFSRREVVHLYFANRASTYLTAEERALERLDNPVEFAQILLKELMKGPKYDNTRTLPEGRFLRSLFLSEDGIFYVDIKEELLSNYPGGGSMELLTVYSIVNTLALNIPQIEKVKILINGREKQTFNGHVDIRHPFKSNMMIVR